MYSEYTTSQLNDSFSPESPIFPCISPYLEESVVTADYWKLMDNGEMVNDNDGWLKNPEGKYMNIDGPYLTNQF